MPTPTTITSITLSLTNLPPYNNSPLAIGKDLSRVSMPVSLNEPLSALQRLCEEVQYCELLDQAAHLDDPCDRMVGVQPLLSMHQGIVHTFVKGDLSSLSIIGSGLFPHVHITIYRLWVVPRVPVVSWAK